MQQPFGFLLGGASPFRTLLNTVRPDVPKPIQAASGFLRQPDAPAGGPVRILDASVPTYPTAFADVRASSATYFNSSGVLSTAVSNTQRIDYDPATLALRGLLVEPAATNLVTTSDFTLWDQLVIFSRTAVTGLDGTSSAYSIVPSNASPSGHLIYLSASSYTTGAGQSSCLSVYAKSSDFSLIAVRENSGACAVFNIALGTVVGTFNAGGYTVSNTIITPVGGSWYRLSAAFTASSSASTLITFIPCDGWTSGDPYFTTLSPAADNVKAFTLFGPQAELGATSPSSVIICAGSTTTRAADSDSFTLNATATALTFTFDDLSTQTVSGLTGGSTYTIPTNLNRPWILYIDDNSGAAADTGAGAAAGTSTVLGVGAALGIGVGSAAGTSTVTATGAALGIGVGSAAGTSTVTATGAALGKGVGNAAGTSTVLATGQSSAASIGASAGVSTVSGVGAALAASVGSAAGTSTDTATGSSLARGVGNAAGTSTALAVSGTVAAAAGTSTVTGVGSALFNAVGAAAGTSTVTATGVGAAFAVGVSSGTSAVSGIGKLLAVAVGSAAGIGTATGLSPSLIMQAVGLAAGSSIIVGVGNAHRPGIWQIAVRGTMDIPTPWKIGNTAIDTIPTVPGAQSIYSDSTPDIYQAGDIYSQTAQNAWKVATRGNMDVQTAWKIAR